MAGWESFEDWMRFRDLDGSDGRLVAAFTIAYKITDDCGEHWTSRFVRFKAKEPCAIWGGYRLLWEAVPPLIDAIGLNPAKTAFVAALSSGEPHASADGIIPKIARKCAEKIGARFELGALSKQVHNPIHGIYGANERNAELEKAAYSGRPVPAHSIVVFDDFITRGATLGRIAQAFSAVNEGVAVYGIALGKTERRSWLPNISNDHAPKKWDDAWLAGEARYKNRS